MSDAIANRTLDLACTVGSVADAIEALEDGADINYGGGAPLFSAIFNRNIEVIRMLIERDADLSAFIPPAKRAAFDSTDAIIEMLMTCAPPDPKAIDPGIMGELDATIRKGGLGKPVLEGDWEGMVNYVEKLERIGLPELADCVAEFVEMFLDAKSWGDAILFEAVKKGKKKIAPLTERYLAVEIDSIETLARAFLDSENGISSDESEPDTSVVEDAISSELEEGESDDMTAIAS
ncbi:MAG: hypothetical protein KDN20_16045 [Verrucomicrobiae bacterium]|nr:hypothetical protein [Verrucomicrobiae bacterium]